MDKVTMLKRLLKPGLLIITSIILISFNHILAGIILAPIISNNFLSI